MNDPHVAAIYYRLDFGKGVDFEPPKRPLTTRITDFLLHLDGTEIKLEPQAHISTRDEAKRATEPLMRAWAVEIALALRLPRIRITYDRTRLIDRKPDPGTVADFIEDAVVTVDTAYAEIRRPVTDYPPPPSGQFKLTPDVESAWRRWTGYLEGREPLLSIAYFLYTLIIGREGSRRDAARRLNVDEQILRKLSELSSTRGDARSARKVTKRLQPLGAAEEKWLLRAVPMLILQMGLSTDIGSLPARLEINALPPL